MAGSIYKKYMWLMSLISRSGGLTYEEISRRWEDCSLNEDGSELSKRTFRNWVVAIEKDFGVTIVCAKCAPYAYTIESGDVRDNMMDWALNAFSVGQMVADNTQLKDRILLEDIPSADERLEVILSAMRNSHRLRIFYQAFYSREEKEYLVEPYAVKLYRKRWYLLCHSPFYDREYTLGVDRIVEVEELEEKFKMKKGYRPAKEFEGFVGIWNNTGKAPVKVRLKITGYLQDYIDTLPLHESQELVEIGDDFLIYEYFLSPNYELEDILCGFGEHCEVLAPKFLRKAVREKALRVAERNK